MFCIHFVKRRTSLLSRTQSLGFPANIFSSSKSFQNQKNSTSTQAKPPRGQLTKEKVLSLSSTPFLSPSYPRGPYTFLNREYFIVSYETDPELVRKVVPLPLKPAPPGNVVMYEWIRMPDSTGFGSYEESGTVIPCITPDGEEINYTLQMFLDCEPPIAAGREIWGFPKKYGEPKMGTLRDTVYGKLVYDDVEVANGTMVYKHKKIPVEQALKSLRKPSVNLKIIPDVDFKPKVAQLVRYALQVEDFKFAYEGPARLNLVHHINAPTSQLPVRRVITGRHLLADITLPYGRLLHNYLDHSPQPPEDPTALSPSDIVQRKNAMPLLAPSYILAPSSLDNREYFVVKYRTTREALVRVLPEQVRPLEEDLVYVQWIKTSGTGLGDYDKFDVLIPCTDDSGKLFHYSVISILNSSSPITAGREIYGQPQKFGHPQFSVKRDTVTGELDYCNIRVAQGTMRYKNRKMEKEEADRFLSVPQLNLKVIPDCQGNVEIAQLVELKHENIEVKTAYESPASLELWAHANAPISDFPVVHVLGGYSITCNLLMPHGSVYLDYLAKD